MAIHQRGDSAAAAAPRLRRKPVYIISHNRARLDYSSMVLWLLDEHWTHWQTPQQVHAAIQNSIVIGAYALTSHERPQQVGFARIISDRATNSLLTDLFVSAPHRRRGVGRMLMRAVAEHDAVRGTLCVLGSRPFLRTFYNEFGFESAGGDIMIRNPTP